MASQVLIKIPVPFSHGRRGSGGSDGSQNNNLKGTCKSPSGSSDSSPESPIMPFNVSSQITPPSHGILAVDATQRVIQLEQNMRFLQEQHRHMLSSLHQEIESLRLKNRELQFQLIINNGANNAPISLLQSFPPSPEDDTKPKVVIPPKQVNIKPLRVEILERETGELKAALEEAQKQNLQISSKETDFKRKIKELETTLELAGKSNLQNSGEGFDVKKCEKVDFGCQTEIYPENPPQTLPLGGYCQDPDLTSMKLEEAERIISHLRRENEDQKRELGGLRMQLSKSMGRQCGGRGGRGDGVVGGLGIVRLPPNDPGAQIVGLVGCVSDGGLSAVNARGNQAINHRFPPLQSQSFWHHSHQQQHVNQRVGTAGGGGMDFIPPQNSCNGGHLDKTPEVVGRAVPRSLPALGNPTNPHHQQQYHVFPPFQNVNRHRHYHNNNGGHHTNGSVVPQYGNGHYRREQKGNGRGGEEHHGGERKYRGRGKDRDGNKQ